MKKKVDSIKWEKRDEYEAFWEERKNATNRYREAVEEARKKVSESEAEYTGFLYREISEGKDLSQEKEQALGAHSKAKEELARAEAELQQAISINHSLPHTITQEQLFHSFNNDFVSTYRSEIVEPCLEKFKIARAAYLESLLEILELSKKASQEWDEYYNRYFKNFRLNGAYRLPNSLFSRNEIPFITDTDLDFVQTRHKLNDNDSRILKSARTEGALV